MKNIIERFVKTENESGFSLLELVVAIGIILILTVGGLIGYSAITKNAKVAAVESAASAVMTAAMAYDANGQNISEAEHNPATIWNNSAKDDSVIAEMSVSAPDEDGQICISVKATHRDGQVATRGHCFEDNTGGNENGGEVINIEAPTLTAACEAKKGVLGLGSKVIIRWKAAEGYSMSNTELLASTSGLGSSLKSLDGYSLSTNTTSTGNGTYTTEIPTNVLGGLLGLGSEIEIALRTVDGEKVSDTASVATNGGLLGGMSFSCRNM